MPMEDEDGIEIEKFDFTQTGPGMAASSSAGWSAILRGGRAEPAANVTMSAARTARATRSGATWGWRPLGLFLWVRRGCCRRRRRQGADRKEGTPKSLIYAIFGKMSI